LIEQYYKKVQPVIDKIPPSFDITSIPHYSYGDGFGGRRFGQESLLYTILMEAFDFDAELLRQSKIAFPTHHGVHLGPIRGGLHKRFYDRDPKIISHFGLNACYWDRQKLSKLAKDQTFVWIYNNLPDGNVKLILKRFLDFFDDGASV